MVSTVHWKAGNRTYDTYHFGIEQRLDEQFTFDILSLYSAMCVQSTSIAWACAARITWFKQHLFRCCMHACNSQWCGFLFVRCSRVGNVDIKTISSMYSTIVKTITCNGHIRILDGILNLYTFMYTSINTTAISHTWYVVLTLESLNTVMLIICFIDTVNRFVSFILLYDDAHSIGLIR